MSKRLICIVVVLALTSYAGAQIDPAAVTDGHVYLFDNVGGNLPDDSANSNAGNLIGSPQVVNGLKGNALRFNGTSDGVHLPDSAIIGNSGTHQNRTVIAIFNCADVSKPDKQVVYEEGGYTRGLTIYVHDGLVYGAGWNKGGDYSPEWSPGAFISAPIGSNEWHAVAIVIRDGAAAQEDDKFEMWMDGVLIGKGPGGELRGHSNDNGIGYAKENVVFHDGNGSADGHYFEGMVDEIWILNVALTESELGGFAGKVWPFAAGPTPADGEIFEATWANLAWRAGGFAVSHDVYFGTSFDDVNSGTEGAFVGNTASDFQIVGFPGFPVAEGLAPGTTYYWRVDAINDANSDSPWKGDVWSFTVPSLTAYNANPPDGMRFVDSDLTLTWAGGFGAKFHNVYFGDNFEEINSATGALPLAEPFYSPGMLELDKTYYWRVDEFDGAATIKGDVWSFTTVPPIPPTADPDLVAWWKLDEGMGDRALDWSGHGNHLTLVDTSWSEPGRHGDAGLEMKSGHGVIQNLTYADGSLTEVTVCAWIRTDTWGDQFIVSFDRDNYWRLQINGEGAGAGQVGWCVMTSSGQVDYGSVTRVDDGVWHHVCGVFDHGRLTIYIDGLAEPSTTGGATFGTGNSRPGIIGGNCESGGYNGGSPIQNVDDIRIYTRALAQEEILLVMRGDLRFAWAPSPADGSVTGINVASALKWSAGDGASEHDVYFGTDQAAVTDADASDTAGLYKGRQSAASYAPVGVTENSGPYYWRIDEVAGDGSVVKGSVWSFSVADYVLIEDFESYNDIPAGEPGSNLVYLAWVDGFDNPAANGSTMGYVTGASMETINVHSGEKSVPFEYNNTTANVSEVVHTFTPAQNWTEHGAQALSLWFFGDANNVPGQLYIKVNGVKVSYDREAAKLSIPVWQPWNIDLASIGVNLQNVTSMAIGIEGASATGTLLLDDIRLYPYASELITPVQPDPDNAGLVVHWGLDEGSGTTVRDISGNGYDAAFTGDPQWVQGHEGTALNFDGIDDSVIARLAAEETWQAYTVSVWAKADTLWQAVNSCVFANHTTYSTDTPSMQISFDSINNYQFHGSVDEIIGPATTDWVHLVVASDGPTVTVYYNGILVSSVATGVGDPVFDKFAIGINRAEDNWFDGAVDDLRVYNRVLIPEEIAGLAGLTQPFDKPF